MAARKVSCGRERWHQFRLLTKKNFVIMFRNKVSTIVQVLVPILFILLLFLLQLAQKDNDKHNPDKAKYPVSSPKIVSEIPHCKVGKYRSNCWTIGYTLSTDPMVQEVMSVFMAQNGFTPDDVLAFETESESDNFLQANPNSTQGVYQFVVDYGCDSISSDVATVDACYAAAHTASQVKGLKYVVQYNQTSIYNKYDEIDTYTGIYIPMVNAIERAIFAAVGNVSYDFTIAKYAHPALPRFNIIATVGPSVIFAAVMFNMVIQAGMIVVEKELKLRESMRVMGLIDGVYWASWIVLNTVMNIIAAFLLIIAGLIFQLPIFLKNDFGTYAVLLILFSLSMVPIGLLLSVLVSKASTATTAGFSVFLVGTLIQGFAGVLYLESSGLAAATAFSFLPFVVFGKGLSDLASATTNDYQTGIRWSARFNNDWWPLQRTFYYLIVDFFIYLFIALYLDNIMYSKRPWYFFVTPTYWRGTPPKRKSQSKKKKSGKAELGVGAAGTSGYEVDFVDSDVAAEEEMVLDGTASASNRAVVLDRLSMTYSKSRFMCCGKISFRAVKDVCVTMAHGELFCLLGHNGAGKSTTIGMLTGLLTPTGGDATILGHSIVDSMDQIRENMGVCPQHDVLWPQLTAREHLELYAGFKKLYYADMEKDVAERLEDVNLTLAADTPCGNYSGGMKRRLSVSIALIGDPKIVFLDEPTTGMDPVSRRQVWNLIERVKRGRVTLLTTHSMEEADVLGDRISIMKGGRLASLGTSLHLKQKYGNGYQVSILSAQEKQEKLHTHVLEFFDDKKPEDASTPSTSASTSSSTPVAAVPSTSNGHSHTNGESHANGKKSKKKDVEVLDDASVIPEPGTHAVLPPHALAISTEVQRVAQDGSVTQYQVPLAYHDYLPDFFRYLDAAKTKLGISNVQLQMTTLEDVFLRVAEQGEANEKKKVLTKEEKRAKCWKKATCGFWTAFVILLLLGVVIAVPLGVSKGKYKPPPTPLRSAEPATFVPNSGTLDLYSFPSAIQVTEVDYHSAFISAFVTAPLSLTLHILEANGDSGWTETSGTPFKRSLPVNINSFQRAQQQITDLKMDTAYNVYFEASNGSISEVSRFRTAPYFSQYPRNMTVAATSSFGQSGYPYSSLNCAAVKQPDVFLLLGDTTFGTAGETMASRMASYNRLLSSSGMRALSKSTSFVATWNDQEVKQGWRQNTTNPADVDGARSALFQSFPYLPGPGGLLDPTQYSNMWRSISYGSNLEVFVLDLQFERTTSQLMSDAQFEWLKNGLLTSQSKFKFIMSSIPITDVSPLLISVPNSWKSAPEAVSQRTQLINHIVNNHITNVLFVSGGAQFGMVSQAESTADPKKAPAWSTYNITESIVGPAGTFVNPQVRLNPRLALASAQFHAIIDSYSTTVYNLDPGTDTIDIEYLDEKCLVAFSESITFGIKKK